MTLLWLTCPRDRQVAWSGHQPRESYCLYVRVLRDSDVVLEQDCKVLEYCWNAGISKDICEAQTRVLPGTLSMDLLSDMESDAKSMLFADLIAGSYLWGSVLADVFVTQQTTQQARRDKAKTREY